MAYERRHDTYHVECFRGPESKLQLKPSPLPYRRPWIGVGRGGMALAQ